MISIVGHGRVRSALSVVIALSMLLSGIAPVLAGASATAPSSAAPANPEYQYYEVSADGGVTAVDADADAGAPPAGSNALPPRGDAPAPDAEPGGSSPLRQDPADGGADTRGPTASEAMTEAIEPVAATYGTVIGTVTNASGTPLEDVPVRAEYWVQETEDGGYWDWDWWEWTAADGTYLFEDLDPGTYRIVAYSDDTGYATTTSAEFTLSSGQSKTVNISMALGGTVAGTITDESGAPLEDVWVWAQYWVEDSYGGYWDWDSSVRTAADGTYTLVGLAPKTYKICAQGWGTPYLYAYSDEFTVLGAEHRTVNLTMVLGGAVSGTVTDESGAPLEGGYVWAEYWVEDSDGGNWEYWESDDGDASDGTFMIRGLPTGKYRITARGVEGYLETTSGEFTIAGAETHTVNLTLKLGGTVTGTVRDASGAPVEDLPIRVDFWVGGANGGYWDWEWDSGVWTAADGTYTVNGLHPGKYRITTGGSGTAYMSTTSADFTLSNGQTRNINLTVVPGCTVTGTITSASGAPLKDVSVWVEYWVADGDGGRWDRKWNANWDSYDWTSADGTYILQGLPPGKYRIIADGEDTAYLSTTSADFTLSAGQTRTVNITMVLGGVFTGTVTSASGAPLKDVSVWVEYWVEDGYGGYWNRDSSGRTAANGVYTIVGLEPGTYRVKAGGDGTAYCTSTSADFTLSGGQTQTANFTLKLGGTVTGTITKASGAPLGDVLVWVEQWELSGYGGSWAEISAVAAATNGTYTLAGLEPGRYRIGVNGGQTGYVSTTSSEFTVAGTETRTVNVTMALGGTATGRVTSALGTPLQGVSVRAQRWVDDGYSGYWEWTVYDWTAADGTYLLRGLPAGKYRIATDDGESGYLGATSAEFTITGTETRTVNLTMVLGGTVTGTITSASGAPLEDVRVWAEYWVEDGAGGYWDWTVYDWTAADGTYTLQGIAPGAYRIAVSAQNTPYLSTGSSALTVAGTETQTVNLTLARGATVTGTIKNASGTPLKGVRVRAEYWVEDGAGGYWDWTVSDRVAEDGTYTLQGIAPGTYRIGAVGQGMGYVNIPSAEFAITDTETRTVNLVMAPGGTLAGTIKNASGALASHVIVRPQMWVAAGDSGYWSDGGVPSAPRGIYEIVTDENGEYTIRGLSPGTWRVAVIDYHSDTPRIHYSSSVVITGTEKRGTDVVLVDAVERVTGVAAASARYDRVKVTWGSVAGVTGYQVYRATSKSGTYKRVTTTTSRSFTDTSLTCGKTYYYKVRAYRTVSGKTVYGEWSAIKSAKPVPAQVGSVKAARASATSVKVTWGSVSGATRYQVYRATSKSGTYKSVGTTTSRSFTNTKLTTGKTYYYKVRAYRTVSGKNVYGPWSSVKSAVPRR